MNRRADFERRFGRPLKKWTTEQMQEALEELLPPRGKAGRPPKTQLRANENYAALAREADELRASREGVGMTERAAIRRVMERSIDRRDEERAQRQTDKDVAGKADDAELVKQLEQRCPAPEAVSKRVLTPERVATAERGVRAARRRMKANEDRSKERK